MRNIVKISIKKLSSVLLSVVVLNCSYKNYYNIEPVGFSYHQLEDIFDTTGNEAFLYFFVRNDSCDMDMAIKNAHQFSKIYIKEIWCQINNTTISLLKDKYYEIDYTHISLGKMENVITKKLLKTIGKNTIELPIIQEYILDDCDLLHEEFVYRFEYENEWVSIFEK